MIRQAQALKKVNPNAHVIGYMNSIIDYPWYRVARKHVTNSSWWLKDVNGSYLSNIAQNDLETWHTWDFSKSEVGDLWMEACQNMTNSGAIDGCFMDGCANYNQRGYDVLVVPHPLQQDVHDAYAQNKPDWMKRLQRQVPGILICGSNGGLVDGVAATQTQNWGIHNQDYAGFWIPMLQRAVAAGVVFQAHGSCGGLDDPDDPLVQTKLAAFLVAAGDHSYWMCGNWGASKVDWFRTYDMPLGEPLANATLDEDGIWRRRFSKGTNVTFDTNTNNGTIQWAVPALALPSAMQV